MKRLSRKQKRMLLRILLSALLFFPLLALKESGLWDFFGDPYFELLLFLVPYFVIGYDVLFRALSNIFHGRVFDECFLMTVATVGALVLGFLPGGSTENAEAVGVMLFYQVGEFFQSVAVGKSRRSIKELLKLRPDVAYLALENGEIIEADPCDVAIGSVILVRPGDRIPLDGEVIEGESMLDTSALTGESLPREVERGDAVVSGCVNLNGVLRVRTTKTSEESTVSRILQVVEESSAAKAKSERFITRFARYYTPTVVLLAVALALIPPLFTGFVFVPWITRALTFLVVSCPCALVISVPMSFFGGIGGASRRGILVKGANYLEALASVETVVFDKTGTLTKGSFSVARIVPSERADEQTLLSIAARAERYSTHPIAQSILRAYGELPADDGGDAIEEIAGRGVRAVFDGRNYYVGNAALLDSIGCTYSAPGAIGTHVYVADSEGYLGCIVIADEEKEDAIEAIAALKRLGVKKTAMLTGDRTAVAEEIALRLGVDSVRAELLPDEKVRAFEQILEETERGATVAFVGDGINDAPVLARADVGIAMGAFGSDAAIEAADVVLMDDKPLLVAEAVTIARKTVRIVRQNIAFAIGIKVLVMIFAVFSVASLWLAVFADVGVAVLAILNAMRTMR